MPFLKLRLRGHLFKNWGSKWNEGGRAVVCQKKTGVREGSFLESKSSVIGQKKGDG